MPARQPFTLLCQLASRPRLAGRADLHLHTTSSDGAYTPAQLVDLARRAGLAAIAVTDHDTLCGVEATRAGAAGTGLEVISGVEITTELGEQELHLLAYFVRPDSEPLSNALAQIRAHRIERFDEMVRRLEARGVAVGEDDGGPAPETLGRRHLAERLVRSGEVATVREAFARYLKDGSPVAAPKWRLPVAEAIALVRDAGGVTSWAHPPAGAPFEQFAQLRCLGLQAIEVEYPETRRARNRQLREYAARLGLAISGGSDCHGPGPRSVGCSTISSEEFERLRSLA
jgi:predicted metal-dependent phosphoesterase TrpH